MIKADRAKLKRYKHSGTMRSAKEIARLENVSYHKLTRHLRNGYRMADAISLSHLSGRAKYFKYEGQFLTAAEIAERANVFYYRLVRSLTSGVSVKKAIADARIDKRKELFLYKGHQLPMADISAITGVPRETISQRLNRGQTMEEATQKKPACKLITLGNETHTVKEWANRLGLTLAGLRERLVLPHIWSVDDALTKPRLSRGQSRRTITQQNYEKLKTIAAHTKGGDHAQL